MSDFSRPTGIPRLQPGGKPGFPAVNSEGSQRFTTARPAAIIARLGGRKPGKAGGGRGPGQLFLSERQRRVP